MKEKNMNNMTENIEHIGKVNEIIKNSCIEGNFKLINDNLFHKGSQLS